MWEIYSGENDNEGREDSHSIYTNRYYLSSIIPNLSLLRIIQGLLFVDAAGQMLRPQFHLSSGK